MYASVEKMQTRQEKRRRNPPKVPSLWYSGTVLAWHSVLAAIHQHDRDAFDAFASLERKLKFTMRPGASLVQIMETHASKQAEEARQQSFCF